jgi:hypothetical protein
MSWQSLDQSFETLSQAEALNIVQEEATALGLPILETLIWMQENYEELDSIQKNAFRTAFRGFRRLLAPA